MPWSVAMKTSAPAAVATIVARGGSDTTSDGVGIQTMCLVEPA